MEANQYIKDDRNDMFDVMERRISMDDPFSSLLSIDLMVTELCNLSCEFCPRSKGYPNQNLHMDLSVIRKIANELAKLEYKNRIVFCGFGEPLLYNYLFEAIEILRQKLPWQQNIHIVTNGDRLTRSKMQDLYEIGLNKIFVSMYEQQIERFNEIFKSVDKSKYLLQHYYLDKKDNYGFVHLSNRSGYNFATKEKIMGCNMPFYAMNIHYDGNVLLCCHDWKKSVSMGNVMKQNLKDIWLNSTIFNEYRNKLQKERNINPCKNCNIDGKFYGNKSRNTLLSRSQCQ